MMTQTIHQELASSHSYFVQSSAARRGNTENTKTPKPNQKKVSSLFSNPHITR